MRSVEFPPDQAPVGINTPVGMYRDRYTDIPGYSILNHLSITHPLSPQGNEEDLSPLLVMRRTVSMTPTSSYYPHI